MLQIIHIPKTYTQKQIEEKLTNNDSVDYKLKSLAINLIYRIEHGELKFITIDSEYNKIKMDTPRGSYHINKELGDCVEYESSNKTTIKKFKLVD